MTYHNKIKQIQTLGLAEKLCVPSCFPARFEQTLTIDALRQATANGDPAIVAIRVSGGGHAIIVDGITTRLGREVVAIRNPWGEQYSQTLEEFTKVFLRQGVLTGKLR